MNNSRDTRYQAAILRGPEILLIRHRNHHDGRTYWLLPGGGREPGETETECVRREALEETHLHVQVEGLLVENPAPEHDHAIYQRFKTYLCRIISGDPAPGFEPEEEASSVYSIAEVGWFNLLDEGSWGELILNDPITSPVLRCIRTALKKLAAL